MNKIMLACSALLFGAVALTSCESEEETYDFPGIDYERLYMQNPNTTSTGTALKNPIGLNISFNGEVAITTTGPCENAMSATIGVDPSLVAEYNKDNGTDYMPIPEGVATLTKDKLVIPAGSLVSDTLEVGILPEGCEKLMSGKQYLIPVTMLESQSSDAQVAKLKKYRSRFFVLTYKESNSLFLTEGTSKDLIGKPADDQRQSWTCIAAMNLDSSHYGDLFGGYWGGQWDFTETNIEEASFTVDIGKEQKVCGFLVNCYVAKNYDFEVSTDNSEWKSLGNSADAAGIRDDNWNTWWGMIAGVSARYVKVNVHLDKDSQYWAWADWGYASLMDFNLLIQE